VAAVNTHVLLGTPRSFETGLYPVCLAMLRDAAHPRWQVENLDDEHDRPDRIVVAAPPARIVLGLVVAVHAMLESTALNTIVDVPEGHILDLGEVDEETLTAIDRSLLHTPVHLSAVVCWEHGSMFEEAHAEALASYLDGDVEACTTVWRQLGPDHEGFHDPGERWTNPAWSTDR